MASILNEYISKRLTVPELKAELKALIGQYNELTGRNLFVYAADFNKGRRGIDVSLMQDDFYTVQDILRESDKKQIDVYLETPGGSGEAAEEIAKFLRKKFDEVNFVIAGEAKSAGTILALSGDNIYMCETGSLGPIDAQIKIGRSVVSAHDYKAWVDEKEDFQMTRTVTVAKANMPMTVPVQSTNKQTALEQAVLNINCPKCGKKHEIPGYFDIDIDMVKRLKLPVNSNVQDNDVLTCDGEGCNFTIDLKPVKNQIETQSKRKITFK